MLLRTDVDSESRFLLIGFVPSPSEIRRAATAVSNGGGFGGVGDNDSPEINFRAGFTSGCFSSFVPFGSSGGGGGDVVAFCGDCTSDRDRGGGIASAEEEETEAAAAASILP